MRTRPNYYSWGRRGPQLVEEMKAASPDVICLQGCDQFDYFQEKLSPLGFIGIYERTEQPQLLRNVYFGDGLAIFWRTDRFKLVGRKRVVLGDERYVSNMALCARLKQHNPFLKPLDTEYLKNSLNIIHENAVQIEREKGSGLESVWMVLTTKYLYIFPTERVYDRPDVVLELDHLRQIKDSSVDLNDHSFVLEPMPSKRCRQRESIRFWTNDPAVTTRWISLLKEVQIGSEVDVWTSQLLHGYSLQTEFRRIKQCQELQEHIARVSASDKLLHRHIGTAANKVTASRTTKKTMKRDDDEKDMEPDGQSGRRRRGQMDKEEKRKKEEKEEDDDLSNLFKKLMLKRITIKRLDSVPIGGGPVPPDTPIKAMVIDPNVKASEDDDVEEKGLDEMQCTAGSGSAGSAKRGRSDSGSGSKGSEEIEDWTRNGKWTVPTQLYRPCILCIDMESNAWGDAIHEIPPLCYSYLTNKSRTTTQNPLYHHSLEQLSNDPSGLLNRHLWCLQSAYALGYGEEPELTAFNRYWPEGERLGDNLAAQQKTIDFTKSVEMATCSDLILFSPQHFRVLKLQETVSKEWIYSKWNKTLPNADYPSDHTMIGVEFEMAWHRRWDGLRQWALQSMQSLDDKTKSEEPAPSTAAVFNSSNGALPSMAGNAVNPGNAGNAGNAVPVTMTAMNSVNGLNALNGAQGLNSINSMNGVGGGHLMGNVTSSVPLQSQGTPITLQTPGQPQVHRPPLTVRLQNVQSRLFRNSVPTPPSQAEALRMVMARNQGQSGHQNMGFGTLQ